MDKQPLNRVTALEEWIGAIVSSLCKIFYIALTAVCLLGCLPFKCLARIFCCCRPTKKQYTSILITGASSGIGAELARQYAKARPEKGSPGVRLVLVARRKAKLEEVKAECEALGAIVELMEADVTDRAGTHRAILAADDKQPLDLVIANAGLISHSMHGKVGDAIETHHPVTDCNVMGMINTTDCIIPRMKQRKAGQLVFMASVASYFPAGDAWWSAYNASKIWTRAYAMGLRQALEPHNIGVTTICPGYVKSEMVDDISKGNATTGALETDYAVRIMIDAIAWNKGVCTLPSWMLGFIWGIAYNVLPPFVFHNIGNKSLKPKFKDGDGEDSAESLLSEESSNLN